MKAIISDSLGVRLAEVPAPEPGPEEILVRVAAASLNRADLVGAESRNGKVLGMEWAGEIVRLGSAVSGYAIGDRVMCTGAGAFAEFAATDVGRACLIPDTRMSFEEATVLTLALQTMHNALVTHGRVQHGDRVLIHGASSAIGLMGLQIAKWLGASRVIGTSTNELRRTRLAEFGCDLAVDPERPDWIERVLAITDGGGVDVIIDQVTGKDFPRTMQAAAIGGRIVNVGRLGGGDGGFDFQLHALRRLTYVGVTFRTRTVEEIRALNAAMLSDLQNAIAVRALRLPIDRIYPLARATDALEHMKSNRHFGKIVLSPTAHDFD